MTAFMEGDGLTPSHARKGERKYRYYVSRNFIVAGRQPPELTAQALRTGRFDIPVGWAVQKGALGFAPPV